MKKDLLNQRQKSIKSLKSEVEKAKVEMTREFAEIGSANKRNFKKIRKLKLEMAQNLTIIREKELAQPETKEDGK